MHERLATRERGRFAPGRADRRAHRRRARQPRLARGRPDRPRRAGRPGRGAAGHAAHGRSRPGAGRARGHRGRRRHGGRRRPSRRARRRAPRRRRRRAAATRDPAAPDLRRSCHDRVRDHRHRAARHDGPALGRRPARRDRGRRRRDRARQDHLGRLGRRGAGGGRRWSTPAAAACCRDSSTRTRTWSSPVTGRRSSPPAWPARRTPPAASRPRSPPPAPRRTSCWPPASPAWSPRWRAAGPRRWRSRAGTASRSADEARSLALARGFTPETTFLGAHVVPPEYAGRADDYVALVAGQMLDACAPYARWVDVFCDRGAFDADQARTVLEAGIARGLAAAAAREPARGRARVSGSVSSSARPRSTTARTSSTPTSTRSPGRRTVATLLPGAEFSTRSPYPDARRLIDAGVTVALATDCNPGSSYTSSMAFCIALAVREMRMTPAEAVWSATAGGAAALRRDDIGVIRPGARADLVDPAGAVVRPPRLPPRRRPRRLGLPRRPPAQVANRRSPTALSEPVLGGVEGGLGAVGRPPSFIRIALTWVLTSSR